MEEQVGIYWHRLLRRVTRDGHPDQGVSLARLKPSLRLYFRALGGDAGLRIEPAQPSVWAARRGLLARVADTQRYTTMAYRDDLALYLPAAIDCFDSERLNRDCYFWLTALAAHSHSAQSGDWFFRSAQACASVLAQFPGLLPRYRSLVRAHLSARPNACELPDNERDTEQALVAALHEPGNFITTNSVRALPQPVPLWLHPEPPATGHAGGSVDGHAPTSGRSRALTDMGRRKAQRVSQPKKGRGLITIRMENILTWGEFVNVDRDVDEEDDLDAAEAAARDIDRLAISNQRRAAAARLKFDLELPAEACDDTLLHDGLLLPEWDWRTRTLQPDRCRVTELIDDNTPAQPLPETLQPLVRQIRRQLESLRSARRWRKAQSEGSELDLDRCLELSVSMATRSTAKTDNLYTEVVRDARDLACLIIADLSQSTDAYLNDHDRVIDVIARSLFVFGAATRALGDALAIYGFSSRKRDPIRIHQIKHFDAPLDTSVFGRIGGIKPGFYTRMGAAIRFASRELAKREHGHRVLLLLTDGKPNDLDQYEGRYGIEDTRHAVQEARLMGLMPFCVTIDQRGHDYLPHLFGPGGYVVIQRPEQLPQRLPLLYAQLTRA